MRFVICVGVLNSIEIIRIARMFRALKKVKVVFLIGPVRAPSTSSWIQLLTSLVAKPL